MRALQVNEFGDPSRITVSDVPERDPGASEVKIRVGGVGIGYSQHAGMVIVCDGTDAE